MIKKNKRYIVFGLIAFTIASSILVYDKVFNAEHREISAETTAFTISAENLQFHFANDQAETYSKFINSVVETYGTITEVAPNYVILENRVQIDFLNSMEEGANIGDVIHIKGRCVGFDELLLLAKIDQATILKTQ